VPRRKSVLPTEHPRARGLDEPAWRVLRQFRVVFNSVKTHFQQIEKRVGIGGAQLWALSLIRDQPGRGVTDLARAMDIRQSTASNLVRSLVERGLITTQRQAPDRRSVQLHVLPSGRRLLAKAPGPFAGVLPGALARLDAAALHRLDRDLSALISALDADTRSAKIPLGS
jgi:DNA-binding MarR family transcriptional regulator